MVSANEARSVTCHTPASDGIATVQSLTGNALRFR
jgi:hypothetical protein